MWQPERVRLALSLVMMNRHALNKLLLLLGHKAQYKAQCLPECIVQSTSHEADHKIPMFWHLMLLFMPVSATACLPFEKGESKSSHSQTLSSRVGKELQSGRWRELDQRTDRLRSGQNFILQLKPLHLTTAHTDTAQ